ncbi:ferrous iron transporter B [Jonesia quinghaiensis]|uniref:ferrous iron transporter B n=1 Tax=Jonesia quinghaiensis TaxID=262806 RepID=UPI00041AC6FB|nr:ferrous iron transporter B [Jonesia quinghaiensis]
MILLVGHPNVGKSTLFNTLTGSRQKTMNAPRTTVTMETGTWRLDDTTTTGLVDLPGTYSLLPQSPDEEVTAQEISRLAEKSAPDDLVIVVLDATALASSLYLLRQVQQHGATIIGALTLNDVAHTRGSTINTAALAHAVGIPIVELNPRTSHGINDLAHAVTQHLNAPAAPPAQQKITPHESSPEHIFDWVASVLDAAEVNDTATTTPTDTIDSWLLRPWLGIPLFFAVLWSTFHLTTTVAGPLQDLAESFITGPVTTGLLALTSALHAPPWVDSMLVDGLLGGVGTVLSFLPLMVIIFTLIYLLEDSGYLARVAVMGNHVMQKLGLDGRAILPLVIGFGCNIPALSATKTIPDSRHRLLTGLLVPFSSCTARLVIYLFLASAFFPNHAGTVVFLMYLASALTITLGALVLSRTAFRSAVSQPLLLVLPAYQTPRLTQLGRAVFIRCTSFITRAGVLILSLSLGVWVLMAFPATSEYSIGDPTMPAHESLFGATADTIAPIFAPAGFDDWHASAALITGFVAKEAVVGTFATTYGVDEPQDPALAGDLGARLRATFDESSGGHPGAAALAFMVFCLVYTPCLVTVAEQRRLFGGRITALAAAGSLTFAWVLAVVVFQVGRLL